MPQTQENQAQFFPFAAGSVWPQNRVSETWSRGKNSRLGSSSLKTASHPGFAVCNSTTALGLRAGWVENRIGAYRCARYYDPTIGRFISEDPLGFDGGDVNYYAYVHNNPINLWDAFGLSSLVFNRGNGTITVIDGNGNVVGTYPAANNAQTGSRGPWDPGTYDYSYHTTHPNDSPDSPYGSNGNFVFNVPGCTGCGVHSGRVNTPDRRGRRGPQHATNGCIRTTDDATSQINNLTSHGDPLTTLTVQ